MPDPSRTPFAPSSISLDRPRPGFAVPRRLARIGAASLCTWLAIQSEAGADPLNAADAGAISLDPPAADLRIGEAGKRRADALALYYKAQRLEGRGKPEDAVGVYEDLLDFDPGNLGLAGHAAALAARFGDIDGGLGMLENALKLNPDNLRAYLTLSDFCASWANADGYDALKGHAESVAQRAANRFPAEARAHINLAQFYLTEGEREKAAKVMENALAQDSDYPGYWLDLGNFAGNVYRGEDRLDRTNAIFEKALALAPGDEVVVSAVADYYSTTMQHEKAARAYEEVIRARPDLLIEREKLAIVYKILKDYDKAIATLEELIQINPHRAKTRRFLADLYFDQENYAKAAEHLEKAVQLGGGSEKDYVLLARMLLSTDQAEQALNVLKRGYFQYPDSPDLAELIAGANMELERYGEAIRYYEKIEGMDFDEDVRDRVLDAGFYFQFGAAVERAKDFARAADLFRKSIDRVPADEPRRAAQAYNYLGYMWLEQGINIDEAGELIKQANELLPDTSAYVDSLGWFHFVKENYGEAVKELRRALALLADEEGDPDPILHDHLAQALFKNGEIAEAVREMEVAVSLKGATDEMRARLDEYRKAAAPEGGEAAAPAESRAPDDADE
ncbi:MAG: tetratricopeptide repeat protein [Verrucomicrobiales bacterium]